MGDLDGYVAFLPSSFSSFLILPLPSLYVYLEASVHHFKSYNKGHMLKTSFLHLSAIYTVPVYG